MAQLFFKYGTMNSGKSIDLLKISHNYKESGKNPLLLTSALDNRDGYGLISSRIGISESALAIADSDNLVSIVEEFISKELTVDVILVDEVQFFTKSQIRQLATIVDTLDIPVMCFGLKTDYENNLFEGSEELLVLADKLDEIKTMCWYCDKKAKLNLRVSNKDTGKQVQIGGNDVYKPVCRSHYYEKKGE